MARRAQSLKSLDDFEPSGPTLKEEYIRTGRMSRDDNDPNRGTLPEVVANRMIRRIAGFAGVPLLGLFSFFIAYFVARYKFDITVLPVVVASTTLGCIGAAGVGITYGIMSSSWDEDIEGTALGWEEASKNFMFARDGLMTSLRKERKEEESFSIDQLNAKRNKTDDG